MSDATRVPDDATPDRPDTIVVYASMDEWRWTRKAPNGVTIAASTEGYNDKRDAMRNITRTQGGHYVVRGK
jgi:uncharacterized protein YegP (UPF0339 family)